VRKGTRHTRKSRRRMKSAAKGRIVSEETKEKIRAARSKQAPPNYKHGLQAKKESC
jgi:hypothetical protein